MNLNNFIQFCSENGHEIPGNIIDKYRSHLDNIKILNQNLMDEKRKKGICVYNGCNEKGRPYCTMHDTI